jgi:hypothetical protein
MIRSKQLSELVFWVKAFGSLKPTESYSDARWRAMYVHIVREYIQNKQ